MIDTLALVLLLSSSASASPRTADECQAAVAPAVVRLIRGHFPHHRLPVAGDNLAEDREYSLQHGGTGCLRIASGDFDGDRRQDIALLLTPLDSSLEASVPLVVARHRKGNWILEELHEFANDENLYLESTSPGTFSRSAATDADHDELDHNEVRRFESIRTGLIAGRTESNGAAFFYTPQRWVHVWISY